MAFVPSLPFHTSSRIHSSPRRPHPRHPSHHIPFCKATPAPPPPPPSTSPITSLPPRTIPSPLPTLYVYDHCPFCVRVRHILGLKNVKYNLVWLANDDVATPSSLVGRKIVPIFQPHGSQGSAQCESLDICAAIDGDEKFGTTGLLKQASKREDIAKWMDQLAMPMRRLSRIRFSRAPLPEFVFRDAREAYIRNHPLSDPHDYEENMRRSPEYIKHIQDRLDELADMVHSPKHCSPHGLSYDDIVVFPKLRALTIVKGLQLPKKIRDYVQYHSEAAEIPLYDSCAM